MVRVISIYVYLCPVTGLLLLGRLGLLICKHFWGNLFALISILFSALLQTLLSIGKFTKQFVEIGSALLINIKKILPNNTFHSCTLIEDRFSILEN